MTRSILIGIVVLILAAICGWYFYTHQVSDSTAVSSSFADPAAIAAVTGFGEKMQMVSLLAPMADRTAAMAQYYAPYVAPELLTEWEKEGSDALGRSVSSPWPARINIVTSHAEGNTAVAEGNVIEVVNDMGTTTPAAVYPVTFTLEKRGASWLITSAVKGAYSVLPQKKTIVGVWECLPHKDTTGPQTLECAFGIAADQSDGHYAVDTSLMQNYPVDFPTGTKVQVTGVVTPADQLNSIQKYDIDGIIQATSIEKI